MKKLKLIPMFKTPPVGQILAGDCLKLLARLPDASADLVFGSPPYVKKGLRYGAGSREWPLDEWVAWMAQVTTESVRVARNVVIWIVNGAVEKGRYLPACEGLVYELYKQGIVCERPAIWHKNSAPSRKDWFTNDWEFCLAFRPEDSTRYFNWEAIGTPPKYKAGGQFRQRGKDGKRKLGGLYPQNKITRPRDVFKFKDAPGVLRATVGGGHLGSKLASLGEAPFPESLVRPFLKSCVPPGGIVCDPFVGSGSTISVAEELGLKWLGFDLRESQVELSQKRIAEKRQAIKEKAKLLT